MRRTNSGAFKNKPDIILEAAKLDSALYNRNEMRYPPMASLVGFMFLDRKNVVADRDVQTPMGQMEYTHGHQSQSVVCDGKVVFQGELAVEPAQIPLSWLFSDFAANNQLQIPDIQSRSQ